MRTRTMRYSSFAKQRFHNASLIKVPHWVTHQCHYFEQPCNALTMLLSIPIHRNFAFCDHEGFA
jgi:hypothetical protein